MDRARVLVVCMLAYAAVLVVDNVLAIVTTGVTAFAAVFVALGSFVFVSLSRRLARGDTDEGFGRIAENDLLFGFLLVLLVLGVVTTLLDLLGVTLLA